MKFYDLKVVLGLLLLVIISTVRGSVEVKHQQASSEFSEKKYALNLDLAAVSEAPTELPTFTPTQSPSISAAPTVSLQPTIRPTSAKPTAGKPTRVPTISIYLENESVYISQTGQQAIVGTLTIMLFILMALEFLSPEILFMIALIIVMLCQILTMAETLSGKYCSSFI